MILTHPRRSFCWALPFLGLALFPASTSAQFTDQTLESGLFWYQTTWGAAFSDLDLDGDLDLYAGHHTHDPFLLWNDGTGDFSPFTYPQPWTGMQDRHGILPISLDFDADPELFVTHGGQGGAGGEPNELYRNDGGGTFLSISGAAGMADPDGRTRCVSAADFNGDHRVDLYLGKAPDTASMNSLYRNTGLFSFNDVAASVGLDEGLGTVGGLWGDTDDDGDPDLLVGGEEFTRPTILFRNDGGTFVDGSSVFSPALPVISGADWGDFDNDDDLDLAVCDGQIGIFDTYTEGDTVSFFFNGRYADTGVDGLTMPSDADTLWARLRVRAFFDFGLIFLGPDQVNPSPSTQIPLTDEYVSIAPPPFTPGVDRGIWVWREFPGGDWIMRCSTPSGADNFDGWFFEEDPITGVTPFSLEDPGFVSGGPRVWRNDGGTFVEVSGALNLPAAMVNPRDISWIDYDNDADLDLHVVDMGTTADPNAPDALFRNDGTRFTDVTAFEGVAGGTEGMGDGAVWGDTDNDGDLDVFVQQGAGPAAYSMFAPALFLRNDGDHGNSLQLFLTGRQSGAPAIGTKVRVVAGGQTIHRRISANSWRGFADPHRLHIGIGGAALADSVIVEWPTGTIDTYRSIVPGLYELTEGILVVDSPLGPVRTGPGWSIDSLRPQPFRDSQSIALTTERTVDVRMAIYDISGRLIRSVHEGPLAPGTTHVAWDGKDERGRRVPAGVYFFRASDGRLELSRKSVRVR